MVTSFPVLTILWAVPMLGAAVVMLLPATARNLAKWVALTVSQLPWLLLTTRTAVVAGVQSDAVRAARARGVHSMALLRGHVAPVSVLPTLALLGTRLPELIAGAAAADILVLPEYGLAAASRDLVIASLPDIATAPMLVISGVSSAADDGYIVNDGVMVVTTPAGGVSRVINLPRKIFPAQVGGYRELIRQGSEVRVFLTESWTMATLICFDSMNAEIISQLADFGVNLLVVAALSEKSAAIIGSATSLCHRSQAFVVIATGPARWASTAMGIDSPDALRSEAVFAGPYAATDGGQVALSESAARVVDRPNLWTFNYTERVLTSDRVHNS